MGKPFFAHTNLGIVMVQNNWTVTDLSFEARINPRYLGYYLKGERQMTPDHLARIAQVLNVDPMDLFQSAEELTLIAPHQDHQEARRTEIQAREYTG